ncbi:nucleoside monophosphate kinase [Patescibacteria group bacterium]|nr:nucleoside monophosphate kinase [Patescibacteria group bacterium]
MGQDILKAVILFGPPGSGKGTQAELLSSKFGFFHLDSSKVLEEWFLNVKEEEYVEIEGEKYYAKDEKKLWETGILMSPPVVAYIMKEKINEVHDSMRKNLVTSGSLRTLYEAEQLYPVLEQLYGKEQTIAVSVQLKEEDSIFRNSHRRICELMRHSILYVPETENLTMCPLDGSQLVKRKGLDDPETIKTRLREYAERTSPALDYLKRTGVTIEDINGNQPVAEVFKDISKVIK